MFSPFAHIPDTARLDMELISLKTIKNSICAIAILSLFFSQASFGQTPSTQLGSYSLNSDVQTAYVNDKAQWITVQFAIAENTLIIANGQVEAEVGGVDITLVASQFTTEISGRTKQVYLSMQHLQQLDSKSASAITALKKERSRLKDALRQVEDNLIRLESLSITVDDPNIPDVIKQYRNPLLEDAWRDIQKAKQESLGEGGGAVSADPFFAEALFWKSIGVHEEAISSFVLAFGISQENNKDVSEYVEHYRSLSKYLQEYAKRPTKELSTDIDYSQRARLVFARGISKYRCGEFEDAARLFTQSLLLKPQSALTWYYRSICFKELEADLRARHDAIVGVQLERWSQRGMINGGLSHVQGSSRIWLEHLRANQNVPVLAGN
tara:strand:+ start:52 stop:1197 length:1146 start_codon:yes stop_codon:yes gene_type:complete